MVTLRKFTENDIENKVKWVNDSRNNRYLHYDLPLEVEKTRVWFEKNKNRADRLDLVIEEDGVPVGLVGVLGIKDGAGEVYAMLHCEYTGRGIAGQAMRKLAEICFLDLHLSMLYAFVEKDNLPSRKMFMRCGYTEGELHKAHLIYCGRQVDRYYYQLLPHAFFGADETPVSPLCEIGGNEIYIKREDALPLSYGGNKARKALYFMCDAARRGADCVVTYGSQSSNHARIIAQACADRGLACYVVTPEENAEPTFNSREVSRLGAHYIKAPLDGVADTIDATLARLKAEGKSPYFIAGGGHGNLGTLAFVHCYDEIVRYEKAAGFKFDCIFFASGTGTTQAGLVCGALRHGDLEGRDIVGISIARKNPRGGDVVRQSIKDFTGENAPEIIFCDDYICGGYAKADGEVEACVKRVYKRFGIRLDTTYVGKAFCGMEKYIAAHGITGKKILFVHTGGTPLTFDRTDLFV